MVSDLKLPVSRGHTYMIRRRCAYNIRVRFVNSQSAAGFIVDDPEIVCSFGLEDHATRRGNQGPGFFSTLPPWNVGSLGPKDLAP